MAKKIKCKLPSCTNFFETRTNKKFCCEKCRKNFVSERKSRVEIRPIPAGTTQKMLSEMDIETLRSYGYDNHSQIHIPFDSIAKLNSKVWMSEQIKTKSASVIAKELGVTFPTVMGRVRTFNLKAQYDANKKHHSNDRLSLSLEVSERVRSKEWLEEAIKTKSVKQIADELDINTALVYRMLYKFELTDIYNSGRGDRAQRKLDTCSRPGCNNLVTTPRNKYCSKECRKDGQREAWQNTCTERYDVANPINIKGVREKHAETMMQRYGVKHANQSDELMGRTSKPEDLLKKFNSKDWLEEQIKSKPVEKIAEELGVDIKLVMRRIKKFGLSELYVQVNLKD